MFTSSINDEALETCTVDCCDENVIPVGEGASQAKFPADGAFERLVSSQRENHFLHGVRTRIDSGENFDQILNFPKQNALEQEIGEFEYDNAFQLSLENPEEFWAKVGHRLTWFKPWDKVLDNSNPPFTKWFVGGMLNACYNAVDRHVENGFGERLALIHDSPVTSSIHRITYSQLLDKVSLLAGVYSTIGVKKGDRVLIYMPMIPEAIISMLATARLGAIHSVVFGGFAARELQTRIEHAEPKVIVAANCGVEPNKTVRYRSILQEALLYSSFKPSHVIMYERPEIKLEDDKYHYTFEDIITELDWQEALKTAHPHECVPVEANEPLYILYTSGTTDQPKGVVRPVGGHLATLAWTMYAVYGMGCPHQNCGKKCSKGESEVLDLECSKVDKNHQNDKEEKNMSSEKFSGDQIEGTSDKYSPSREGQDSCINQKIMSSSIDTTSKSGKEFLFFPSNSAVDGQVEKSSNSMQNISSESNSHNFFYKLCLRVCQLLMGAKSRNTASYSSHNGSVITQDHHGSKQKEKKAKLRYASHNISPNYDRTSHQNISKDNESMGNPSPQNYEVDEISGVERCLGNKLNVKPPKSESKEKNSLVSPSVQLNYSTRKQSHKTELIETSDKLFNLGEREPDISQKYDERMNNHLIKHSFDHFKSENSNLCVNTTEMQYAGQRGTHHTEFKSQLSDSDGVFNCKNSSNLPSGTSSRQGCHHKNNVWWAASDMGWVVGHSYVCYAPLTAGLTSIMYEGKPDRTPDPGQYFRVINQHGVNALLTAPTALRVIKRVDPNAVHGKKYSTKSLKTIFVAGESLDLSTKAWAERTFKVGVVNHWWQTETGHSITATFLGLGHSPNDPPGLSTGKPCPGFDLHILRDDGSEAAVGEEGRIAARLPLPPGTLSTLYKNSEKFKLLYFSTFPGYYDTMDAGYTFPDSKSSNGWIVVTGREDDVVSVAGHRLSASAIEAVALQHTDVSDALVVGIPDCTKGEVPLCLYVPTPRWKKNGESEEDAAQRVSSNLIQMVRELVGPIAAFRLAFPVPALPKTRSGKIPRKSIARMARGLPLKIPATIEDPLVYEDIKVVLQTMRLSQAK